MIRYIIRVGEMMLKGANRNVFEHRLRRNISRKLKGSEYSVHFQSGRFYVSVADDAADKAERALATCFGIIGFSRSHKVDKRIEDIVDAAISVVDASVGPGRTPSFRIYTRRSDKGFPMTSHDVDVEVGAEVQKKYPEMRANLKKPELLVRIEIRESAYVYGNETAGPAGLPVGCAGRGMLLLSGGIDSPVAGYFIAKRGMKLDAIYFDAYPYTPEETRTKVRELVAVLAPYNVGMTLITVPFADVALRIADSSYDKYRTLFLRAAMFETATRIAKQRAALALITGDSLSQVSSQTVESMRFTNLYAEFPVFRPLVGFDKLETIDWAKKMGSFDISIRPFEDCCSVFTSNAPAVHPNIDAAQKSYQSLELERLLAIAAEGATMEWFDP